MLLEKALESVIKQKFGGFEIIVIDDCSTDDTFDFLTQYKANYRITLLRNDQNLGLQQSLNKALESATGEFVARIDDDDYWFDEKKLEKQYNILEKHSEIVLIGTGYITNNEQISNPTTDLDIRNQILFRCPFQHSTVMFKRVINGQEVRYKEELKYAEDWELWLRIGQFGEFYNIVDKTTFIRTGDNLSERFFLKQHVQNLEIIKQYQYNYPRPFLANVYHRIVIMFFKLFNINGKVHRVSKVLFNFIFRAKKNHRS